MAQSSYQLITLTGNLIVSWPSSFDGGPFILDINDVQPNQDGWHIALPDASLVSRGQSIVFNNVSNYNFIVDTFDGNLITQIDNGQILQFYLIDNSTAAGIWRHIPYGAGMNGVTSFTAASSNNSVNITDGIVTPPGGTIDFQLPPSLVNLYEVAQKGFPAITGLNPLTWAARELIQGTNITISGGDGVSNNPVIGLNNNITGISKIEIGDMELTGTTITSLTDIELVANNISASGAFTVGSTLNIGGNISAGGNMTITGTLVANNISSTLIPKAFCSFTDNSGISIGMKSANISKIEGSGGTYEIYFDPVFNNGEYVVDATLNIDTTGGAPYAISHIYSTVRANDKLTVVIVDNTGQPRTTYPAGANIIIMSQ